MKPKLRFNIETKVQILKILNYTSCNIQLELQNFFS